MAYFLTIRKGSAPEDSYPAFATADPEIIELVGKSLARKLASTAAAKVSIVKKHDEVKAKEPRDRDGER